MAIATPERELEHLEQQAKSGQRGQQLSFNVGLPGNKPDFGEVKISGGFFVGHDLKRQAEVIVTVTDTDGTVLAHGKRKVTGIHFKDNEDAHGNVSTTRIHTLG